MKLILTCAVSLMFSLPAVASEEAKRANPHVVIETEIGSIEIELFKDKAPLSSAAFLAHIDNGKFATNGGFYRVVRADNDSESRPHMDVVQGGVLTNAEAAPGVAHESTRMTGLSHVAGAISLARLDVGSANGGTFFIALKNMPWLDYGGERVRQMEQKHGANYSQGFAVFGRVVKGLAVAQAIQQRKPSGVFTGVMANLPPQRLDPPVKILKTYRK